MSDNIKYLDLDAIAANEEVQLTLKLAGVEHQMKPFSAADFVFNVKKAQSLGTEATPEAEMTCFIEMLQRSFPTIQTEQFMNMGLKTLERLMETVKRVGGQEKIEQEAKAGAEANPQPAV